MFLLGNGSILSPGSVEGYPSPEEPPTHEASKDTLHSRNLRANAMRRIPRKTNVDDSFYRAKCMQELRHPRRLTSRERRNLQSSQIPRMARDAAEERNLRRGSVGGSVAKVAGEPPEQPSRGTSGTARLRSLRQMSVGGSTAKRRARASD